METNRAVEQSKIIRWSERPWNQSGKKGLWRKGFAEKPSFEFWMIYWTSKRRCEWSRACLSSNEERVVLYENRRESKDYTGSWRGRMTAHLRENHQC